jgi:hypothetical protein
MAFTDHCDVFISVLEAGLNRVVQHVRRQWPSLFNYGTAAVAQRSELLCQRIDYHPVVERRNNPLITVEPPVPIVGSLYALDWCAQLTKAVVDFSPGNVLTLPPELGTLGPQRFAIGATVCGGLACPPGELVDHLPFNPERPSLGPPKAYERTAVYERSTAYERPTGLRPRPPLEVLPTRGFRCFCLDGFVVGGARFTGPPHRQHVIGRLDGIEIVDIKPEGLENSIECYGSLVTRLVLLPQLAVPTVEFVEQDLMGARVAIEPSPVSAGIAFNPALEDDQIKVFLDLDAGVAPPSGGGGGGGGGGGPPEPPLAPGVDRPRVRTDHFDLTLALSQAAVTELFNALRDAFTLSASDSADFGPFTMGYAIGVHLEGGTVTLRNDGTIRIAELDVKWDAAKVWIGIDLPEVCVGGFCIIPTPFGCAVRAPRLCVFDENPDIGITIDISGLIASELSATVRPLMKYSINHPVTVNDWDARDMKIQNRWVVLADIVTVDVDLFDIADIVGDLLHEALDDAIDNALGFLPGWAKSLVKSILGPIIDLVVAIIDLPDDVGEWIADKLGVSFGVLNLILTAVADHFAAKKPLLKIEEPLPLLPSPTGLIDVLVPIEFLGVRVNADELIVEGDIGG